MEESSEEWKTFIIYFDDDGSYKVKKPHKLYDCSFTSRKLARAFVDRTIIAEELAEKTREYNAAMREIRKEPDLAKRSRKYRQLCQPNQ